MALELGDELRSPRGYVLGHSALDELKKVETWPTVLNYELWLHFVADPASALAQEIERILSEGSTITEDVGEELAAAFLPKAKLIEKQKLGSKYRRRYEKPKTPLQRLLESPQITATSKAALRAEHAGLNPFHLREELERKLRLYFNAKSNLDREATMS